MTARALRVAPPVPLAVLLAAFLAAFLAACAGPSYVDEADKDAVAANPFSKVVYHVSDAYKSEPPECVAVLPFKTPGEGASAAEDITFDQTETVRRAFYAQLAPQGKRDVEIPRVDFVLKQMSKADRKNYALIGKKLNCDALVIGEVTEYGSSYFAVYSRVAVGADLKMISAADGALLWQGRHVAESNGGRVPLSPVGLAMGLLDAARNMDEEQLFRVIDDLARRLVKTIPDNRMAVLEEPLSPVLAAAREKPKPAMTAGEFLAGLEKTPLKDKKAALIGAIEANRFGDEGAAKLYRALIAVAPDEAESFGRYARFLVDRGDYAGALKAAERSLVLNGKDSAMYFLKARVLIKLNDLKSADASIVQAIALDGDKVNYLNGLGYVNSLRGDGERALAAYRMALAKDPANGFAYYNTGVILYNQDDVEGAAEAFYGAGLSYLKSGDYGQAEKVVADLKGLAAPGLDLKKEIETLEKALNELAKGEGKNG